MIVQGDPSLQSPSTATVCAVQILYTKIIVYILFVNKYPTTSFCEIVLVVHRTFLKAPAVQSCAISSCREM